MGHGDILLLLEYAKGKHQKWYDLELQTGFPVAWGQSLLHQLVKRFLQKIQVVQLVLPNSSSFTGKEIVGISYLSVRHGQVSGITKLKKALVNLTVGQHKVIQKHLKLYEETF